MRVLYAGQFDPAGVMVGHRGALRAAGVEAYVALNHDFRAEGADGTLPGAPDVLVVAPAIGTGAPGCWATWMRTPPTPDLPPEVEAIIAAFPLAKKVAYFHGSTNLAANVDLWAARYRTRGFVLAASTLDYAVALDAAYLPPALIVPGDLPLAPYRADGERLVVAHTPSNWAVCHTEVLLDLAKGLGIDVRLAACAHPRMACIVKTQSHATFDHLRGSFSVNSLEGATYGSIPLFATSRAVRTRMAIEGLALPPVHLEPTRDDLREVLRRLSNDPALTRDLQCESRRWAKQFTPAATAERLVAFFGSL